MRDTDTESPVYPVKFLAQTARKAGEGRGHKRAGDDTMLETFQLIPLRPEEVSEFKKEMQESFREGARAFFEKMKDFTEEILPEADIDASLSQPGATAWQALVDGKRAGGAVVVIDEKTGHNALDFLYVRSKVQSRGIGTAIWHALEKQYPKTKVWETCTPYFDRKNIHFYINKCGFHAVEFFCDSHPDPDLSDELQKRNSAAEESGSFVKEQYFEGLFKFEKGI